MSDNGNGTMAYIARCGGCMEIVGAIIDDPDSRNDTADAVRDWIRAGRVVERHALVWVRENFNGCMCKRQQGLPGMGK